MADPLCTWASTAKESPTLAYKAMADEIIRQGGSVVNFGIGEMNPAIPVPKVLKEEMKKAIDADETHYSPALGDPELRTAVSEDLNKNFGVPYSSDNGPKDAIFKTIMAIMSSATRRRKLLTFAPLYEAFENIPYIVTGEDVVLVQTGDDFLPDPKDLRSELEKDDKIGIVVVNSPNNPTGVIYPKALLQELANVLKDFPEVFVLSDEVYRVVRFNDPEPHHSIGAVMPERTVVIGGMSKEVSGTGLRLGFAAGPKKVVDIIGKLQGNTSSCVHLPTQKAYARFLKADLNNLPHRMAIRNELASRRKKILDAFKNDIPKAKFQEPEGAFYFFPDMSGYLNTETPDGTKIHTDSDLVAYLIKSAGVLGIPGSAFLRPNYIRFAYAISQDDIDKGLKNMASALAKLS